MGKRIGFVLSGAGVFDGAELHESVLCLLALDRGDAEVIFMAPDKDQFHVVDHQSGTPAEGERRSVLSEAARLARGPVRPLAEVSADEVDAILMPGGFGAAKNLSTWAFSGAAGEVDGDLQRLLGAVHGQGKWIAACCIAPAILARVFGGDGVKVTLGTSDQDAAEVEKTGAQHERCSVEQVCIDEEHRLITTPAYMEAARIRELEPGISDMVGHLLRLA
ncbi:MAG: isoprenoid biosynthesis protein ElbB [Myxococcales bacterium]|nr:isoprenoid biosynthesis protein ElbB [Myxococcales bacterium]|tara:strand:+ start:260 stop:919 length:660 start_codon:yes stop_codon:yes gene_type:complete